MDISEHQNEILRNEQYWQRKPILAEIYRGFHRDIAANLSDLPAPLVVELGSGIGNIKEVIPHALRTDLFPNPWLDQTENAYALSFGSGTVSDLILFDVFHHLQYPGTALKEFWRVLRPGGRVLVFDPFISLMGLLVYGLLHHEPVAWNREIDWCAPEGWVPQDGQYYAAQGNATRIFFSRITPSLLKNWKVITRKRYAAFSYVASGGYSAPQLYPDSWLPHLRRLDSFLDNAPAFFATRILAVLEKKEE